METKDRGISIRKSVELPEDRSLLNMLDFADRVAEISFKAGIGEVVEWIQEHGLDMQWKAYLIDEDWQAKLKEWEVL